MKIKKITVAERRGCLGKIKHNSELAAQQHLDSLRPFSKTPQNLNYYKCQFCYGWHCGNNKSE